MMKKLILLSAFAIFAFSVSAAATTSSSEVAASVAPAQQAATVQQSEQAKEEEPGIALCMGRGLCNIGTGWLEIPRCMIYDNSVIPFLGLIVGIPEGAVLTVARTCCGVLDILSFGTMGSTFHGKVFPDTVFQANWIHHRE